MAQRRSFSAALKAKVAIEAIRGQKTLNEIASQYEVHPNRVWQWRKLALEKLAEVMADGRGSQSTIKQVVDVEKLHEKIGRQAVEIDFLKKKLRQLDMLDE
jgi:transposase-like protein